MLTVTKEEHGFYTDDFDDGDNNDDSATNSTPANLIKAVVWIASAICEGEVR